MYSNCHFVSQAPLLSGKLCGRVFHDGCTWCFEPPAEADGPPTLTITLAKRPPDNRLWGYLMQADRDSQAEEKPAPPERRPSETKAW